jgi:hypothetical protein
MTNMKPLRAFGPACLSLATILGLAVAALPAAAGATTGDLFNNTNPYGVFNGPTRATTVTLTSAAQITELVTYHWNNGHGARPGTIALRSSRGKTYGPYQAHGTSGQNNAPNVNWIADIHVAVPAGTYTVLDSNPTTWSQNLASHSQGFTIVRGTYQTVSAPPGPAQPTCSGPSKVLYTTSNIGGVSNGPTGRPSFTLKSPVCMTQVTTYHWNNGQGATPGIITLQLHVGGGRTQNFSFQAQGTSGQGGAPNVNWVATANMLILPAGTYTVLDSDPATWSYNAQSGNRGFVTVSGIAVAASSAPPTTGTPGQTPVSTTSTPPAPCHRTTFARVEMEAPPSGACFGPPGTPIKLYVLQKLPSKLAAIVFKAGPIARNYTNHVPGVNVVITARVGGALVTGDGMSPGSVYTIPAPSLLCMPGSGHWGWDVYLMFPGSTATQDDVDYFSIACP